MVELTKRVTVRFSEEDFSLLSEQAEKAGLTLANYVRKRVLGKSVQARESCLDKEAILSLRRAVGMIKQIFKNELARPEDTHDFLIAATQLLKKIDQVEEE